MSEGRKAMLNLVVSPHWHVLGSLAPGGVTSMNRPPTDGFDGVLADLDGVVYTGPRAIDGATAAVGELAGASKSPGVCDQRRVALT